MFSTYNLMSLGTCKHHDRISIIKVMDVSNTAQCFLMSSTFFCGRVQRISRTYLSSITETLYPLNKFNIQKI